MRPLSILLLALALPVGAQNPIRRTAADWWVSGSLGSTFSRNMGDKASGARWEIHRATPVELTVERGTDFRTFGLALAGAAMPMDWINGACGPCRAQINTTGAWAFMRAGGQFFGTALDGYTQLRVGAVTWSGLKGTGGDNVPSQAAKTDFSYGMGIGLSLPLNPFDVYAQFDIVQVQHPSTEKRQSLNGSQATGFNTLRLGLRYRLTDH